MFTYIYIYLILYFLVYIYLLVYLSQIYKVLNIEQMYLTYLFTIIKKYSKFNPVIVLFFLLSGLPPVGFFFVKFNFLLTTYQHTNILFQVLIFSNILLTMFFYLQIFNTNNDSQNLPTLTINALKGNKVLLQQKQLFSEKKYTLHTRCIFFIFFNFFFLFIFPDFFLIFFNYAL